MNQKKTDEHTLLVAVGCGGVFFHGLTRMAVWCGRRGKVRVMLIDPDTIEEKNRTRQWGTSIGQSKVKVAGFALGDLTHIAKTRIYPVRWESARLEVQKEVKAAARVLVVSSPDNHMCRVEVHEDLAAMCMPLGKDIMEITAGNDLEGGYAYGCVHRTAVKADKSRWYECSGDWTVRHPDIIEEAVLEEQRKKNPMACGSLMEGASVEQTMNTNSLTAQCVWDMAETMVVSDNVGEIKWRNLSAGDGTKYAKVWAKIFSEKEAHMQTTKTMPER